MFWENFLHGNEWYWRLFRTVVQGAISVLIASLDVIVEPLNIDASLKPVLVALLMAILSPIMSALGTNLYEKRMAEMNKVNG